MKRVVSILAVLLLSFLCFSCAVKPDLGYLPDDTKMTFSSVDDALDFLAKGDLGKKIVMLEMGFSRDEKTSILDFSKEMKNRLFPVIDAPQDAERVEIRTVYGSMDPHISIQYEDYSYTVFLPSVAYTDCIQEGNLQEYYRKAHPSFNRPDSYNEEEFLLLEPVELSRTDIDSEAILFVSKISAPYIEFIRDGLIIRITNFDNYGSPDQEALIQLANEVIFEDINLNQK